MKKKIDPESADAMTDKPSKAARIAAARDAQAKRLADRQRIAAGKYRHSRRVDRVDRRGKTVRVLQLHLKPNPERVKAHPCYVVPMGPGRGNLPADGRWCTMTDYLRKRLLGGDVVECPAGGGK